MSAGIFRQKEKKNFNERHFLKSILKILRIETQDSAFFLMIMIYTVKNREVKLKR